jgi:hypothetical protein
MDTLTTLLGKKKFHALSSVVAFFHKPNTNNSFANQTLPEVRSVAKRPPPRDQTNANFHAE